MNGERHYGPNMLITMFAISPPQLRGQRDNRHPVEQAETRLQDQEPAQPFGREDQSLRHVRNGHLYEHLGVDQGNPSHLEAHLVQVRRHGLGRDPKNLPRGMRFCS